jgi:hypothetical protein
VGAGVRWDKVRQTEIIIVYEMTANSIQHGICTQHRFDDNLVMHELIAPTQL